MLTPQQIEEARKKYGVTPAPSKSSQNRIAEFESAWGTSKSMDKTMLDSFTESMGNEFGGGEESVGSKLIKTIKQGGEELNIGDSTDFSAKKLFAPTKAVFRGVGDVAGSVFAPVGAAIDTVSSAITGAMSGTETGVSVSDVFGKAGEISQMGGKYNILNGITDNPFVQKIAEKVSSEDFQRFVNIIMLAAANSQKINTGTKQTPVMERPSVSTVIERTKPQVQSILNTPETVINKVDQFGENVLNKISDIKTNVSNKISGVKDSVMTPKQLETIKNTPESEVAKLTPSERSAYWKNQEDIARTTSEQSLNQIKQKAIDAQAKIDAELKMQSDASMQEIKKLKSEVDQTSVAESDLLKAKAKQVYKNNSQQFEKLFEEEFTPEKQSLPLKQSDLISKLDQEFMNDPAMNPKGKLGLDETGSDITAKDFYDRVRKMKTSTSGSRGTNVYTESDLALNRTRGILTDILKENGIDLSKANKFWQEWKSLQREITAKVKPFKPYDTGTMANILKKSASEVGDAKNVKFIADLEAQLGEKLPQGTRAAVEKLSTAEKQVIADKVAVEEAKAKIVEEKQMLTEMEKAKAEGVSEEIYKRKFASEQRADIKVRNRRILIGGLSALGMSGVFKVLLP